MKCSKACREGKGLAVNNVIPVGSKRDAVASLEIWSPIPHPGVNGVLDRPDQKMMAHQWQRPKWEEGILRFVFLPSAALGATYPQVAVVNSLPWKDAVSSSCPSLPPAHFPSPSEGAIKISCTRSAMFHARETWVLTSSDLHCLQRNDQAIIRWICGITNKDKVSSQNLQEGMQLNDLEKVLHTHRPRWHGHVEHNDGWLRKVQKLNPAWGRAVFAQRKPGPIFHIRSSLLKLRNCDILASGLTILRKCIFYLNILITYLSKGFKSAPYLTWVHLTVGAQTLWR